MGTFVTEMCWDARLFFVKVLYTHSHLEFSSQRQIKIQKFKIDKVDCNDKEKQFFDNIFSFAYMC